MLRFTSANPIHRWESALEPRVNPTEDESQLNADTTVPAGMKSLTSISVPEVRAWLTDAAPHRRTSKVSARMDVGLRVSRCRLPANSCCWKKTGIRSVP